MTGTSFFIFLFITLFILIVTIELYRKFKLKKKITLNFSFLFAFFLILVTWKGDYYMSFAERARTIDSIPQIDSTMYLNYKSRFKEHWVSNDTSKILHIAKVIKLGESIEKEIDFYNNEFEYKTLVIENTYPFFSKKIKREYYLMNVIVKDYDYAKRLVDREIITKIQKDSVLNSWQLNN
jgi:hypothetical protein